MPVNSIELQEIGRLISESRHNQQFQLIFKEKSDLRGGVLLEAPDKHTYMLSYLRHTYVLSYLRHTYICMYACMFETLNYNPDDRSDFSRKTLGI